MGRKQGSSDRGNSARRYLDRIWSEDLCAEFPWSEDSCTRVGGRGVKFFISAEIPRVVI